MGIQQTIKTLSYPLKATEKHDDSNQRRVKVKTQYVNCQLQTITKRPLFQASNSITTSLPSMQQLQGQRPKTIKVAYNAI